MNGDSNIVRKTHSRRLESFGVSTERGWMEDPIVNFESANLEGIATPHDDALVVRATKINYDVAWVFIDLGSSFNIIFKEAFDWMQVDPVEFHPMSTSLFDIASHEVILLG